MNNNPTAFPYMEISEDRVTLEYHSGMSLRDWFAGQAMPAIISAMSAGQHGIMGGKSAMESVAYDAYAQADAMLAARKDA
jgi:hypothetical protein